MEKGIELHYNKYIQELVYNNKITDIYFDILNLHIDVYKDKFEEYLLSHFNDLVYTEKSDCFYDEKIIKYSLMTCVSEYINFSYLKNTTDNIISDITILYTKNIKNIDEIVNEIINMKYIDEPLKNVFYMIGVDQGAFVLNTINVIEKNIDIKLNYGNKFKNTHNEIITKLVDKSNGHIIVYGDYNLGKTYWIKQVIKELCNEKMVIYIPSYLTEQLSNPEFINFLEKHIGAIVICEDAENVFTTNSNTNIIHPGIANILNLTSGILNDITQLQFILSFNITDKKNIDKALFRNGILLHEYKFDKLSSDDATILSKEIGKNKIYTKNISISEVYDETIIVSSKKKNRVGFKDQDDN